VLSLNTSEGCFERTLPLRGSLCEQRDKLGWKLYLTKRRLGSGICLVTSSAVALRGWGGCIITARETVEDIMRQIIFKAREYGGSLEIS